MDSDFLILGGGVGGLTLAATLAQLGKSFLLIEKGEVTDSLGAGLLLAPNAARVLKRLGLLDKALTVGHATGRWLILDHLGALLRDLRIQADGLAAISLHRADLLAVMRSAIPADSLRYGVEAIGMRAAEGAIVVSLANGATVSSGAVVGADGLRSIVRRQWFGEEALRYRGYVGWRGIAPFVPPGYEQGVLSESWGPGGRFGIAPVDARRTYWYASANKDESWMDHIEERQAALLQRFAGWHKPVADLIAATPAGQILVNRIYDGPKLPAWSRGNVTLLGDAAHAMTPNLGQGACLAMEDAWTLGCCIGSHPNVVAAFQSYERSRMGRGLWIQRQSRIMGWVVQAETPMALGVRAWLTRRVPAALIHLGMKNIFGQDAGQ